MKRLHIHVKPCDEGVQFRAVYFTQSSTNSSIKIYKMLVRSQDKGYHFGRQYPNQCACKDDSKTDKTISRKKRTGFHKVEW